MSAPAQFAVVKVEVQRHPHLDVVMTVFVHEGQVFSFYMEAGCARKLAGELEAAYQSAIRNPQSEIS